MKHIILFIILFISLSAKSQNFIDLESGNHQLIKTKINYDGKNLNNVKEKIDLISLLCKSKCKNGYSYNPEIININETEDLFYVIEFYFSCENTYGARSELVSTFYYDGISNELFDNETLGLNPLDENIVYSKNCKHSYVNREVIKKHFLNKQLTKKTAIESSIKSSDELKKAKKVRNGILLGFVGVLIVILSLTQN